jgi:putative Mg2+ transporter-C (MgtC) family protein
MSVESQFLRSLELLLATFLSMVVGLERDRRNQPAGMRTHMLVGFGACLFTILSFHAFPGSDPARVAAQVVSGIGFLGAGTILHLRYTDGGSDIKHLTTAASIWATAGIGMAVGAGAWLLAINGTLISWVVLTVMRRFAPYK